MPLLRLPFLFTLFVLLAVRGVPSVQAQVVIHERVEIGVPTEGAPAASITGGGPIVGYYVYYPGGTFGTGGCCGSPWAIREGSDGALHGPLTVTTSSGAVYTVDIEDGFVPDGNTMSYGCTSGQHTKRYHSFSRDEALLYVPVAQGETITSATVEVVGQAFSFVSNFSPGPVPVGVQETCSHFESWPAEMKQATTRSGGSSSCPRRRTPCSWRQCRTRSRSARWRR